MISNEQLKRINEITNEINVEKEDKLEYLEIEAENIDDLFKNIHEAVNNLTGDTYEIIEVNRLKIINLYEAAIKTYKEDENDDN